MTLRIGMIGPTSPSRWCDGPVSSSGWPEIMVDGETGVLVEGVDDAVEAVGVGSGLSREHCADVARKHFSDGVKAERYGRLYRALA